MRTLDGLGEAIVDLLQLVTDDVGGLGAVGVLCQDLFVHIGSVPSEEAKCIATPYE